MKKSSILAGLLMAAIMANCSLALPVFANERVYPAATVAYTVEIADDELLEQATKISERETRENGRVITTTVYRLKSGSLVTDIFEKGDIRMSVPLQVQTQRLGLAL